jgi:AbiV family abortive infection protein
MIDWSTVAALVAERFSRKAGKAFTGTLSLKEAADGMTACYRNAEALLNDGRLLTSGQSNARALALTILALEELAKIPDLHDTAIRAEITGSDLEWPAFWKRYFRHGQKQEAIASYGTGLAQQVGVGNGFLNNPLPYASFVPSGITTVLDQLKQNCLYTDYGDSGFRVPADALAGAAAILDAIFLVAEERLDSFAAMHITTRRSFLSLSKDLELSRRGTPFRREEAAEMRDPYKGIREPTEIEADLISLMSHRSSAVVPDYFSFSAHCDDILEGLSVEVCLDAFRAVCGRIRQRSDNPTLVQSAARAHSMLKLAFSHLDRKGETDAAEVAFGQRLDAVK